MKTEEFISHSVDETENIAKSFAARVKCGDFIAMYGDLGVGKTAFVRGLSAVLAPSARVKSPTYSLVNEYRENGKLILCHYDMYRVTSDDDLYSTGFFDYTDCIIVAEWCENIPFAIPEHYFRVDISKTENDSDERKIVISEV